MNRLARPLAAAVALVAATSLAACTSSSGAPATTGSAGVVHLTFAHGFTDAEGKAVTALVKQWNSAHPTIQVTTVYNGGNDSALQKTLAQFAAGSYPDIAYEYGSSLADLAGRPQVVELTDRTKAAGFNWNDFYPAEQQAATVKGKVYGVPALVDNLSLVYNKKLFDQAGMSYPTANWTWEDFRAAAKKLTDASKKTYGWAFVNDGSEDTVWRWIAMLWQGGGDLLTSDNTKSAFNSPAGVAAAQLMWDMSVNDHSVYLDPGNQNYLNLFNSGKIGMLWTGPWDLSSINSDVSYGVQVLPSNGPHLSVAGPDNWLVFNNGQAKVDAAWQFLSWLTSTSVHAQFTLPTGDLPIRISETKAATYQQFLKNWPGDAVFVANLGNVTKARPNLQAYPEVSQAIGSQLQGVLIGKISPQAAMTTAAQQADAALAGGG